MGLDRPEGEAGAAGDLLVRLAVMNGQLQDLLLVLLMQVIKFLVKTLQLMTVEKFMVYHFQRTILVLFLNILMLLMQVQV